MAPINTANNIIDIISKGRAYVAINFEPIPIISSVPFPILLGNTAFKMAEKVIQKNRDRAANEVIISMLETFFILSEILDVSMIANIIRITVAPT